MPDNNLFVEITNGIFDSSVTLDNNAFVAGRLDEEDIVRLRVKLEHHRCVVELRLRCKPGDLSTEVLALK